MFTSRMCQTKTLRYSDGLAGSVVMDPSRTPGTTDCVFFDHSWHSIGTRFDLATTISEVTSIDRQYLELKRDPRSASCLSKMDWVSRRVTTRVEDIAYCMLGLFDIVMPLLYGEREKAFVRLQEEILKQTGDTGLLNWCTYDVPDYKQSIFAPSPAPFDQRRVRFKDGSCRNDPEWIRIFKEKARVSSQYRIWAEAIGLTFDGDKGEEILTDSRHLAASNELSTETDESRSEGFDGGTDIASVFSDGGMTISSTSTASLSPVSNDRDP